MPQFAYGPAIHCETNIQHTLMQTFSNMPRPVVLNVSHCKICSARAPLYGVVDFNKSCEDAKGAYLPLSGIPVHYHKCSSCGLVFTITFDHWDKNDFRQHIYNDEYIKVDPEYLEIRPAGNVALVADFIKKAPAMRCLDYGGGNGKFAALMRQRGVDAHCWDPVSEDLEIPQTASFDFMTAFEVLEHTPEPLATIEQALGFLREGGVMLFSTGTLDHLPNRSMDYWYIAPRNGHITLYLKKSLQTLFSRFGYRCHHFNNDLHLAFKTVPEWLT
jgi:hypothetical protein